jgi:tetratricopeptide (TPR) repeat protein
VLSDLIPIGQQKIEVSRRSLRVALNEDGAFPIYFSLPPLEELEAIRQLSAENISIDEVTGEFRGQFQKLFDQDFKDLLSKYEKFRDSPTYLNHLANLCELCGDSKSAEHFLNEAAKPDPDIFFKHKLGTLYINDGRIAEAQTVFQSLNLDDDLYANMRLGYVAASRNNIQEALKYVSRALEIDPEDFGARLFSGALYLATSQFAKAVRNFRVAAEEKANSSPLFVNLAVAQLYLGHPAKALTSLRKALSINPLNKNAVAFFADLALREGRSGESIGPLEKFLNYEQKDANIWARLARAFYVGGQYENALVALKREASNKETTSVWNNIGVVYWKLGQTKRATQYFTYAIQDKNIEDIYGDHGSKSAIVNMLALLMQHELFKDALKFSNGIIEGDRRNALATDPLTCDIYINNLYALIRLDDHKEFIERSKHLLELKGLVPKLRFGILMNLLNHYTMVDPSHDIALRYAHVALEEINGHRDVDATTRDRLLNNAVFVFLECDHLDEAEEYGLQLSRLTSKNAFATATLGLLQLRKDNIERGTELYEDALALVDNMRDRHRIQQKMNLELGRAWERRGRLPLAKQHLKKVTNLKDQIPVLQEQARAELLKLEKLKR